jgi:4-hydroxy-tetrahydrodipicolinate reductase
MLKLGISGAAGKMGCAVVRVMKDNPEVILAAAWELKGHPCQGQDAGLVAGIPNTGVQVGDEIASNLKKCEVAIDFTSPTATMNLVKEAVAAKCPLVIGTTGLSAEQLAIIKNSSERIPIIYATNFSTGINIMWILAEEAARILGEKYDAEIIEWHHNQKKDAPSGTAVTLLESICKGKGLDPKQAARNGRQGIVGARSKTEVGIHAVRAGEIVGEHCALFAGEGERLEIRHQAYSRDPLARGAIRAAGWLKGKPAGFYGLKDVLGLQGK